MQGRSRETKPYFIIPLKLLIIMVRIILIGTFGTLLTAFSIGCSSHKGPKKCIIKSQDYPLAWESALEIIRSEQLQATLQDRSSGVLECEPKDLATIFEPWRKDHKSLKAGFSSTIQRQRRRLRIEFKPIQSTNSKQTTPDSLSGPSLLSPIQNLLQMKSIDKIEVLVWASLDIYHTPHRSLDTWTRSGDSIADKLVQNIEWEDKPLNFWEPSGLDKDYQREILQKIIAKLNSNE